MCMSGRCGGKVSVGWSSRSATNLYNNMFKSSPKSKGSKASKVIPKKTLGVIPKWFNSKWQYDNYLRTVMRDNPSLYNQLIAA